MVSFTRSSKSLTKRSKSKIILVAGGTGAGKTTYARKLCEEIGALRFSIDDWMTGLFWMDAPSEGTTFEWAMERISRAEGLIQDMAQQALAQNLPVVLDLGFTKSLHRQSFAKWSQSLDWPCELHWLDIPTDIRWNRVQDRNDKKGETFAMTVTREMFDFMENEWEDPCEKDWENDQLITVRN